MRSFIRGSNLDNCCCCLVVSDSFRPQGLQHARLPCPSLYLGVMPSNHLILCFPFSSCPQSFPAPGSFPMSGLFASGGQRIGASASILPIYIQGWFPSGLTSLIYLLFKRLQTVFCSTTVRVWKHQFFSAQPYLWSKSHICTWLLEKLWSFVSKVMCLLFNMLSRFVIVFLLRSKVKVVQSCPTHCHPMD